MALQNFRFFALHYLNDWLSADSGFVSGLEPAYATADRLAVLREAAKYYKVVRNFKTIEGEERLAGALAAIDAAPAPSEDTVDSVVSDLAVALQSVYGKKALSAASKFLWLRHRWPVVIYDGQAAACLWASGCQFYAGDYAGYRADWRERFAGHEQAVRDACGELFGVKAFSLASDLLDDEVEQLTSTPWFRERVFDKFLWWNSSGE